MLHILLNWEEIPFTVNTQQEIEYLNAASVFETSSILYPFLSTTCMYLNSDAYNYEYNNVKLYLRTSLSVFESYTPMFE